MVGRSRVVVVLAALVAGCGGGATDDEGDDPRPRASVLISEASKKTLAAGTARQKIEFRTEPDGKIDFSFDGVVDMAADNEQGTFLYRRFEDLDPGTRIEMISHEEIDYVKIEGEETWLKTKPVPEDPVSNATDVSSSLRYLGQVSNDARAEGRETIGGVATTRYRATVDLADIPDKLPPKERESYEKMLRVWKDTELSYQLWIDDKGMIRRLRQEIPFDQLWIPSPGEDGMASQVDLSGFGVDAVVEAPPPEMTIDE